jgi:hypothetical protein
MYAAAAAVETDAKRRPAEAQAGPAKREHVQAD